MPNKITCSIEFEELNTFTKKLSATQCRYMNIAANNNNANCSLNRGSKFCSKIIQKTSLQQYKNDTAH